MRDAAGNALVTAYAVRRPDGNWALMLVNRDQENAHDMRVLFEDDARKREGAFRGKVAMTTFGSEQYVWREAGLDSHADPDGPLVSKEISARRGVVFTLPKASVTILRGKVKGIPTVK